MSPDERDDDVQEPLQDLERGERQMEQRLEHLEEDIEDAKKTAAQRQDAPDDDVVAGDWEGEATGSSQGEDAEDAV